MFFIFYILSLYSYESHLPKDEVLIQFFYRHKPDILELIKRYQTYDADKSKGDHSYWEKADDTPILLKKAGVRIDENILGLWLPNPYSIETSKLIASIGYGKEYIKLTHKYGSLSIKPLDESYMRVSLKFGVVFKHLIYFPEPPRIENGFLLGSLRGDGEYSFRGRLYSSLDYYPKNWLDFRDCIYRYIEPQWFIILCSSI